MYEYYKVISERSIGTSSVTCLVFSEYPTYWFDYNAHEEWKPGDDYLGSYYYEGIHTDILFVNHLNWSEYVPITITEYDEAMNRYIAALQRLKWPADHSRWGRKRPGEPGWER